MNAGIPRYPDDLTVAWLSQALGAEGAEIAEVSAAPVGTGQTGATYRIRAKYTANPSGLPDSFIVKLPAEDDGVREQCKSGYRAECLFYSKVVHRVDVPTPTFYHCEMTDDASEYALLLGDQAPATQGDQVAGCSEAEARLVARAVAGLHGPTWCKPEWLAFDGLAMTLSDDDAVRMLGEVSTMAADLTIERVGAKLAPSDADTLKETMQLVTPWLLAPNDRFALVHGDYRLDNLLFSPDRTKVWAVDWQTLGVGLPTRDLAYFTGTSLPGDIRGEVERGLVAEYHAALAEQGVTGYDLETCWRDYRYGMPQALLIPTLGCAFATGTDRGIDMFAAMLERGCRAIRELGTLALIADAATATDVPAVEGRSV